MKRAALILAALAAILTAAAAPVRTATEGFVTNKIAEAVAAIPMPGNYAAVSNAAMNARSMTDRSFITHAYALPADALPVTIVTSTGPVDVPSPYTFSISNGFIAFTDAIGRIQAFFNPDTLAPVTGNGLLKFGGQSLSIGSFPVLERTVTTNTLALVSDMPGNYAAVSNRAMTALQSYTETDPTVPAWAKAETKPTYTATEVGAISTETDPTIPAWAKAENKPTYTASEVGAYSTDAVDAILQGYLPLGYFRDGQTIPMYWGDGTKLCDFGANWLGSLAAGVQNNSDAIDDISGGIPQAVSNIVTTALVRERLGVYLYVGADGGIYVHTNED